MNKSAMQIVRRAAACLLVLATLAQPGGWSIAEAYVLNRNIKGTNPSTCPLPQRWAATTPGIVDRRWNTTFPLTPNIVTDLAAVQGDTVITQVDRAIRNSFDVWTSVGTSLNSGSLSSLTKTTSGSCDSNDGLNTICFNQSDLVFGDPLILAFTRANSWDQTGVQPVPGSPPTTIIGEIVDADIYFQPSGSVTFATREALPTHASSYDLESVLIHELGHFFGFSHSAVLRAIMFPFATRGQFTGGVRCPTPNTGCDLPLTDDDRAGLRVLYPNPADTTNIGVISGFILPANPLSLAGLPSTSAGRSVTGIFGAHVVAVDAATGAVVAGTLGGWSCNPAQLPSQFDGFYKIEGLPINRSYKILVEPLDGPTDSTNISIAINALCSQVTTNDICTPPTVNTGFTTKIKPQ